MLFNAFCSFWVVVEGRRLETVKGAPAHRQVSVAASVVLQRQEAAEGGPFQRIQQTLSQGTTSRCSRVSINEAVHAGSGCLKQEPPEQSPFHEADNATEQAQKWGARRGDTFL